MGVARGIYDRSPTASVGKPLGNGEVGVVFGATGAGRRTMLIHIGLDWLLGHGAKVLHVSLEEDVEAIRSRYDEVLRAVGRIPHRVDWARAGLTVERNRMVLSLKANQPLVDQLRQSLDWLHQVANHHPQMVIIDDLVPSVAEQEMDELRALGLARECSVWLGCEWAGMGEEKPVMPTANRQLGLVHKGKTVELSQWYPDAALPIVEGRLSPRSLLRLESEGSDSVASHPHLSAETCTLYSGGSEGSEACFGEISARYGIQEVNFTFPEHRQVRSKGSYELSPLELSAGDVRLDYVSAILGRVYRTEDVLLRRVLQLFWHMVSRSQQVFVVGVIQEDGTVVGGTGWSVELARMWKKPLWVFDQSKEAWLFWNGHQWVPGEPSIRYTLFTGTGTRSLTAAGQQAIEELFARSFPKTIKE